MNHLLQANNLSTHFHVKSSGVFTPRRLIKAVDDVSFHIDSGEVLGLVGESGCGKSTVGRTLTKLENSSAGQVLFRGTDILSMTQSQFRPLRREIQMIFQDPFASLNPRLTVEQTLIEPLFIHKLANTRQEATQQITDVLEQVGLDPSAKKRYPHEFSGGQRQRIGIARVMILKPKLIIADEAVSALDVSIQAQVLNLLKKLQQTNEISMLFISHDLAVVRHISDRVAVMYDGKIVESASVKSLFNSPQHDYTRQLLEAIPRIPSLQQGY